MGGRRWIFVVIENRIKGVRRRTTGTEACRNVRFRSEGGVGKPQAESATAQPTGEKGEGHARRSGKRRSLPHAALSVHCADRTAVMHVAHGCAPTAAVAESAGWVNLLA